MGAGHICGGGAELYNSKYLMIYIFFNVIVGFFQIIAGATAPTSHPPAPSLIIYFGNDSKSLNVDLELQITDRAIGRDVMMSHDCCFHVDVSVLLSFFQCYVSGESTNLELFVQTL